MIHLLTSYREPGSTTNPYIVQLNRALQEQSELKVRNFSFPAALLSRYDVFHVHWPETLFNARSIFRRTLKQVLMLLLLVRLDLSRTAIVWTVHNLAQHESLDPFGSWLVRALRRRVDLYIRLNAVEEGTLPRDSVVILHGHYRDWYLRHPQGPSVPGRMVFFGLVRPYKGVEELIEAFRSIRTSDYRLAIAGRALNEETRLLLTRLAEDDDRVELDLRFLDEPELVSLVSSAELVVLPYREMYNSGSLLAALSLSRPVLVPRTQVNEIVSDEAGAGWVYTYDGPISGAAIEGAIAALRAAPPAHAPDLSRREWADAGAQHLDAYRRALALPGHSTR